MELESFSRKVQWIKKVLGSHPKSDKAFIGFTENVTTRLNQENCSRNNSNATTVNIRPLKWYRCCSAAIRPYTAKRLSCRGNQVQRREPTSPPVCRSNHCMSRSSPVEIQTRSSPIAEASRLNMQTFCMPFVVILGQTMAKLLDLRNFVTLGCAFAIYWNQSTAVVFSKPYSQ